MAIDPTPAQAVFVVPPQVHLLDLSGAAHLFYEAACFGAPVSIRFVNPQREELPSRSSCGLQFAALEPYESLELGPQDWVFVPGLDSSLLLSNEFLTTIAPFLSWLQEQHASGARICSVCTGAFVLAEAGVLDGRECTTHWKYLDRFRQRYPAAQLQQNRLFVDAGNVCTSAGVASGIDLALYLLEQRYGAAFAARLAKEVVVFLRRTEADPQLSIFLQYRNHLDERIHQVQDLLAQSLDKKPSLEAVAEQVYMSSRNLTRLFKQTTGITIGAYLDKLRVERALQLFAEGQKVDAVTAACGLQSPNRLRQLLKKYQGVLPGDVQTMAG